MTTIVIVVVIAGIIAVACALALRRAVPVGDEGSDPFDDGVVGEPVPIDREPVTDPTAGARWSRQFESRNGPLDDAARLTLIRDLAMLRAPWCVPLLEQAAVEEVRAEHREEAERALRRLRRP